MNISLCIVVLIGLIASGVCFKLGDHEHDHVEDHDHQHQHQHDHEHSHDVHNQEAREGRAEAISSDFQTIGVDSEASNLAVDFSRFDIFLSFTTEL